jgi:hypothetical protein
VIRNLEPILARRAEEEKRRAEAAQQAEAAQLAEEEKRRAEAARQAEDQNRRAELAGRTWRAWQLSVVTGVCLAVLALLLYVFASSPVPSPATLSPQIPATEALKKGVEAELGWAGPAGPNYAEAMRWYRSAAERGDAQAQYNLGFLYAGGFGVPQDLAQARIWMQKAAAGGAEDAKKWLAAHP